MNENVIHLTGPPPPPSLRFSPEMDITGGLAGGPMALFDGGGDTLIISPASNFMAVSNWHQREGDKNRLVYGIMGDVDEVPAGTAADFILYYSSQGVNRVWVISCKRVKHCRTWQVHVRCFLSAGYDKLSSEGTKLLTWTKFLLHSGAKSVSDLRTHHINSIWNIKENAMYGVQQFGEAKTRTKSPLYVCSIVILSPFLKLAGVLLCCSLWRS